MTRTALYRHYDADGCLLYVGITDCLSERDKQHAATSHWHGSVQSTVTEWCLSRQHALDLEAVAIKHEKPEFNTMKPRLVSAITTHKSGAVHPILPDVEAFLDKTGMGETYFGKRAANNSELVARKFIAENSPSSDVSQRDGSLPSKDVGSGNANVKGQVA